MAQPKKVAAQAQSLAGKPEQNEGSQEMKPVDIHASRRGTQETFRGTVKES